MPRPCKNRFVSGLPGSVVYKPAGVPAAVLAWVTIGLDEFETIRLLDYQGLDQEKAAGLMGVSRPTVTRIYASARRKIAEALSEGKAICIEGGNIKGNGVTMDYQNGKGYGCGRGGGRGFGRRGGFRQI